MNRDTPIVNRHTPTCRTTNFTQPRRTPREKKPLPTKHDTEQLPPPNDRGDTSTPHTLFNLRRLSATKERVMGIEPTWPAWKAGTLPLSYTRDFKPHLHTRPMAGAGFEPAKALPPDLQSGPFGRSGIPPITLFWPPCFNQHAFNRQTTSIQS